MKTIKIFKTDSTTVIETYVNGSIQEKLHINKPVNYGLVNDQIHFYGNEDLTNFAVSVNNLHADTAILLNNPANAVALMNEIADAQMFVNFTTA